jgi:hypothetical protein
MQRLFSWLMILTLLLAATPARAVEPVPVPGSDVTFVPKVQQTARGQDVTLTITGTALRKKFFVNVYALASYLQDGVAVKTADELAKAEAVKLLHMVMERPVSGSQFLDAFKTAVGADKARKEFAPQFATLETTLKTATADTGEYVLLTYIPEAGTRFRVANRIDITIPGKDFAQALWGTFLGDQPIDSDMRKGLVSRLGP